MIDYCGCFHSITFQKDIVTDFQIIFIELCRSFVIIAFKMAQD